jgi:predicted kinase
MCGLPGSGKSTLARQLAQERSALRLCADEWMTRLAVDLFDEEFRARLESQFWRLAQEVLVLGQSVILESGFWSMREREMIRGRARELGVGVELHLLNPPLEELWRRLSARNDEEPWASVRIVRHQLDGWVPLFDVPGQAELDRYDAPL